MSVERAVEAGAEPEHPVVRVGTSPATVLRGPVSVTSETLFRGATELQIVHRGALYRLKQTSLGKLILTK